MLSKIQAMENEERDTNDQPAMPIGIAEVLTNGDRFLHSLDNMLEGAQIHDADFRYLYVNDALVGYSSYTREELIGFTLMEKYPGIEQTGFFKRMQRCIKDQVAEHFETDFVFPNGTTAYFELSIEPIPQGVFILSVDRTEQKKAKEKLLKVNRLYAFISAINQAIVHIVDEGQLLQNVCDVAIGVGLFRTAWIGMVNDGKMDMVHVCGDESFTTAIQKYTRIDFGEATLRGTPTGEMLVSGKYAVSNNIRNDAATGIFKDGELYRGVNASISIPLKKRGAVIGVFSFNSAVKDFFDEQEITLLEEAASDISFALENFERAKRHAETEELVIRNEKRFRALIEKGTDMITLSTNNGVLLYGSPSITKEFGYSAEEIPNASAFDFIHPEDLQKFAEYRGEILETPGKSYHNELRLLHKDGTWIWCEATITNMLHEPGLNAMVSNFRNISERKAAELARLESEALVQTIYAASLDAVIIIDDGGLITKWDAKSEALFGWKEYEVKGMKLSETIIPERFREMHSQGIKHYLKTGIGPVLGRTTDMYALKKNGDEFDVSLSIAPSLINGRTYFIGFIRDISEKKLLEKQREFDRNNLHALINNTTDLMWSLDINAKLITFNKPFHETIKLVLGKELEKGDDLFSLVLPADQSNRFKASYLRAFRGEVFTEVEHNESPVESWSEISYYPIRKGSEVIGTACHSRDISARKHAEMEKEKMTTDLIQRNKALEQFAYIISHNLRAPVANILGIVSLLNDPVIDIEQKHILNNGLSESVIKLDEVVKDLNHILEAKGGANEAREKVSFTQLVNNIKTSIQDLIGKGNIEIGCDFSEIDELFTLKSYLYSIFYNLITNSIKYRRQDVPCTIRIKSSLFRGSVELVFSDNGLGIDLAKKGGQVFGLYKRFHPDIKGKGMGLYMVRTQVEALGGSIAIKSEPDKGTEFKIEFER